MGETVRPIKSKRNSARLDAETRRQAILDAALALFAERGYGVSLDEIAKASGITRTVLYYYYPSKKDLFIAVQDLAITDFARYIAPALTGSGSSRLRNLIEIGFRFAEDNPHGWDILFCWTEFQDDEIKDVVERTRSLIKAVSSGMLADSVSAFGTDMSSPEGDLVFEALATGFATAVSRWRRSPSRDHDAVVNMLATVVARLTSTTSA